jgi:hypothetical protein
MADTEPFGFANASAVNGAWFSPIISEKEVLLTAGVLSRVIATRKKDTMPSLANPA